MKNKQYQFPEIEVILLNCAGGGVDILTASDEFDGEVVKEDRVWYDKPWDKF